MSDVMALWRAVALKVKINKLASLEATLSYAAIDLITDGGEVLSY